jgi:glycerol kinase
MIRRLTRYVNKGGIARAAPEAMAFQTREVLVSSERLPERRSRS